MYVNNMIAQDILVGFCEKVIVIVVDNHSSSLIDG